MQKVCHVVSFTPRKGYSYSLYLRNGFENLEEDMHFTADESETECTPMYLCIDFN